MTVRLNITLSDETYRRLKRSAPPKGMSAYIDQALQKSLKPDRATLDQAYRDSWTDQARFELAADWAALETEGWPE